MRVALAVAVLGSGGSASAQSLRVVTRVRPGAYYVGQAIDLFIDVIAGRGRPEVTVAKVAGADVTFVESMPLKPISAGGIGNVLFERNLFRYRYRLIARRAGELIVPPVTARLDGQVGSSRPLALTVKPLPLAGRTAEFLGGVGPFEVEAGAEPTSVRSGQWLEYRVTVSGPAARGINGAPGLSRLVRLPIGLLVERMPDESVADPPSHTFVYRLRPTRAGEATLPPVAVAAFDPVSARYVTRVTAGIPLRVVDVPGFDPRSVDYAPAAGPEEHRMGSPVWRAVWFAVGVAMVVLVALAYRRARKTPEATARRVCTDVRKALEKAGDDAERGRTITEGLVRYLGLTVGRPPGALTPVEAGEGVARATGSEALARRAFRLVADCDRAQFDGGLDRRAGSRIPAEGTAFFNDLARASIPRRKGLPGHRMPRVIDSWHSAGDVDPGCGSEGD